jgi:hypothetical protein
MSLSTMNFVAMHSPLLSEYPINTLLVADETGAILQSLQELIDYAHTEKGLSAISHDKSLKELIDLLANAKQALRCTNTLHCLSLLNQSLKNHLSLSRMEIDQPQAPRGADLVQILVGINATIGTKDDYSLRSGGETANNVANQKHGASVMDESNPSPSHFNSSSPLVLARGLQHDTSGSKVSKQSDNNIDAMYDRKHKQLFDTHILSIHKQAALNRNTLMDKSHNLQPALSNSSYVHHAFSPMFEEYLPEPAWLHTNLPDLHIVGWYKAGTTFLYRLLESHPNVTAFGEEKESCQPYARTIPKIEWNSQKVEMLTAVDREEWRKGVQKAMYQTHKAFHEQQVNTSNPDSQAHARTVNACMKGKNSFLNNFYLRPSLAEKRGFFVFRDPADWLWAVYNYWSFRAFDPRARKDYVVLLKNETYYRTPELFHEYVASASLTAGGQLLLKLRSESLEIPRKARLIFGHERVLFLRNEDMLPSEIKKAGGVLDQISEFAMLDKAGFSDEFTTQIYNCNEIKGVKTKSCGSERTNIKSFAEVFVEHSPHFVLWQHSPYLVNHSKERI